MGSVQLHALRLDWTWIALWAYSLVVGGVSSAGEPPRVLERVKVYSEPGRFAGWPANHGIWSWGDEILVGFSRGYDKDNGADYHIDPDRPEDFLLARSKDGGATWSIEVPDPPGALVGTRGMRHGAMPPGIAEERPSALREPIDFTHRDFALAVHMADHRKGASCFYFSYDRGRSWRGPFGLPLFGQRGVMGRTDYIVEGRDTCLVFLTATKSDGTEGRPFSARTTDGGLTWQFLAFIGPEPRGYAVMPSTVRVSATDLVTTLPPARLSPQMDRRVYIARRWPIMVLSRDARPGHWRGKPAVPGAPGGPPPVPDLRLPRPTIFHPGPAQRRPGQNMDCPVHPPRRRR